jgi:cation-transporting ATPase E
VLGFVGIRDEIRTTARDTMAYFVEQGVDIRVISGDDPMTVSAIAETVGVPDAQKWVDATFLESEEENAQAVQSRRVFGRVTPTIKRELIKCLREEGHTVAMTGDGVNDILALKEANCSVAMASGSAAARNVADIVLADSDFAHMPEVVAEGRRSINNLQRSASLFLMKTVYAAALALVCVIMPPFPLLPIQMSLVSTAIIGVPSFVLALEPNHELVRGRFLSNVLSRSLPASAAITYGLFVMLLVERGLGGGFEEVSTCCMLLTAVVGIILIWRIAQPLNALRSALLAFCVAYVLLGCTLFTGFFGVVPLTLHEALACAATVVSAAAIFNLLYDYSTVRAPGLWDNLRAPGWRASVEGK